jgi:hypothetical protein
MALSEIWEEKIDRRSVYIPLAHLQFGMPGLHNPK